METIKDVKKQLETYKKERYLMDVNQFDKLLKRVNIEDDKDIKKQILNVIEKYLDNIVKKEDVSSEEIMKSESIKEVETKEIADSVSEKEEDTQDESHLDVEENEEASLVDSEKSEEVVVPVESPDKIEEDTVEELSSSATKNDKEEQSSEDKIEEESQEDVDEKNEDETKYVEKFGLLSTTNDDHLEGIISKGGVLFREKRSFMLTLALDDEVLAIGKTQKLEQFPKDIQDHLKKGGFLKVNIEGFSEIEKRSRARYVDVTFNHLVVLEDDHWIVKNVNELLEKGNVPEHAKKQKDQPVKETPIKEVKETKDEVDANESEYTTVLTLHSNFVDTFKNKKEQVLQQPYVFQYENEIGKLVTKAGDKLITLAIEEKTAGLTERKMVRISDYALAEKDNKTYAKVTLELLDDSKVDKPASTDEKTENKNNVEVITQSKLPADFPLQNKIELALYSKAARMFSLTTAKAMIGDHINLGFHKDNNEQVISLAHETMFMAKGKNTLINEEIKDSKWIARITDVELNETSEVNTLIFTFDQLEEVSLYPYEKPEKALPLEKFIPIPDDKPSAVEDINKDYDPKASEMLKPNGEISEGMKQINNTAPANETGATQKMVGQKNISAESNQQVMDKAKETISGVIEKTLDETGIKAVMENKQTASTTQVVGNIKDDVGAYTETETIVQFATGYPQTSWERSLGKEIHIKSKMEFNTGETMKVVSLMGKNDVIIAQGKVPLNNPLFADGNHHIVKIASVESSKQMEKGFIVELKLADFKKVA